MKFTKIGKTIAGALCGLVMTGHALAATYDTKKCDVVFTEEQERILGSAYETGRHLDFGPTLQAIAWKESFVGDQVVRANPTDGRYGSYGITHVQLSTGAWMLGEKASKPFRNQLKSDLSGDDRYALQFALAYLVHTETLAKKITHDRNRQWRTTVASYNGTGEMARRYTDDVVDKVKYLKSCGLTMIKKRIKPEAIAADNDSKLTARQRLRERIAEQKKVTPAIAKAAIPEPKRRAGRVAEKSRVTTVLQHAPELTQAYIQKKTLEIYKRSLSKAKGDPTVMNWAKGQAETHIKKPLSDQFLFAVHTLTAQCVASGQPKAHTDLDFLNFMLASRLNPSVSVLTRKGKIESVVIDKAIAITAMEEDDELSATHIVVA